MADSQGVSRPGGSMADGQPSISRPRIYTSDLQSLVETHTDRYRERNQRAADSRALLNHRMRPWIPDSIRSQITEEGALRRFETQMDGPVSLALDLLNVIQQKKPRLVREPLGGSEPHLTRATRVERGSNAAADKEIAWDSLTDMLQNDGEGAGVVAPAGGYFRTISDYYEGDNTNGAPKPAYRRDSSGTPASDAYDLSASNTYIGRAHAIKYGLPFETRIINPPDCIPIGLTFKGDRVKMDGLLIRREYNVSSLLRQGYRWGDGPHLEVTESAFGGQGRAHSYGQMGETRTLTELWYDDGKGPFVAYSIDSKGGKQEDVQRVGPRGQLVDSFIDLKERFGLETLPVCYGYGRHWSTPSVDGRSIPFIWPFLKIFLLLNDTMTAIRYHTILSGYGTYIASPLPDPNFLKAYLEGKLPMTFDIEPGKVVQSLGKVEQFAQNDVGKDVWQLMSWWQGDLDRNSLNKTAFGGGEGDPSGHAQTVMQRHALATQNQVFEGARQMYEVMGEHQYEIMCKLGELSDNRVVIALNTKTLPTGSQRAPRQFIEINPADAEGLFDLTAIYPVVRGENLALRQQNLGLVQVGLMTDRDFLEQDGVEEPEQYEALLWLQRFEKTDDAMYDVMSLASDIANDEAKQERIALWQQQKFSRPDGIGVPNGFLQGATPPPSAGAAMAQPPGGPPSAGGVGMPDPGASMLGGQVNSGMEGSALANNPMANAVGPSGTNGVGPM